MARGEGACSSGAGVSSGGGAEVWVIGWGVRHLHSHDCVEFFCSWHGCGRRGVHQGDVVARRVGAAILRRHSAQSAEALGLHFQHHTVEHPLPLTEPADRHGPAHASPPTRWSSTRTEDLQGETLFGSYPGREGPRTVQQRSGDERCGVRGGGRALVGRRVEQRLAHAYRGHHSLAVSGSNKDRGEAQPLMT